MADFAAVSAAVHDFRTYHPHLKIQDRASHRMIPLQMTDIQRAVRLPMIEAERERRPTRVLVLKARREGVSTIIQATFCHRGCTRQNVKAYTIADERDKASNLHGMLEGMYHALPDRLKPAILARDTGRRLRLVGGSDFRTETAKDANAGRSGAASLLHASEFAFWDYPEKTLISMLQVVPDEPGTAVFIESTANGVGNAFHQEWLRASRGDSAYVPLFFSWLDDPGYDHGQAVSLADLDELDDEEYVLMAEHGARPGQIAWRRHKLRQDLMGDVNFFHQEYPATPLEAFLSTGRQFFPSGYVLKFRPADARSRYSLVVDFSRGRKKDTKQAAVRDEKGPLWIYELPEVGTRYVIFVDPAGVVGEMKAKHFATTEDPSDYTVMWVLNCKTLATAAVWHGRLDLGLAALEAAKLGVLYKKAVICPETTGGYGFVITEKLREIGYSPIHRDRQRNQYERNRVHTYGFATTTATRPLMLEGLKDVLRENPELLRHGPLRDEMQTFVIGNNHIPSAAPGCHDDLVMAAAGAYAIAPDYVQRTVAVPAQLGPKKRGYTDVLSRATRRSQV
jgi:hypothetical protein